MKPSALVAFLVVDLALVAVAGVLWTRPVSPHPEPAAIAPQLPDVGDGGAVKLPPDLTGKLHHAVDRPLFFLSRRPVAEEPAAAAEPADEVSNIEVSGIFRLADGTGGLILRVDGQPKRVLVGESVGKWTLASVDESSASLKAADGNTQELKLVHARQPESAAAASLQPAQSAPVAGAVPGSPQPGIAAAGTPPAAAPRAGNVQQMLKEAQARREAYLKSVAAARAANRAAQKDAPQQKGNH